METRKGRTRRQKLTVVMAAEMTNATAAADSNGIPRSTVRYWMADPDLALYREKAREAIAEEMPVLARLAIEKLIEAIRAGKVDPRDLITAMGVAIDKSQLLSGAATSRVESRDLTDVFNDYETRAIVEAAREYLDGAGAGESASLAEGAAVEGAGS